EERHAEQVGDDDGEDDTQNDRGAGAKEHADLALVFRQTAAGKRDDDGVVARQQRVDPDDLAERQPEGGRRRLKSPVEFHLNPSLPSSLPTPAGKRPIKMQSAVR